MSRTELEARQVLYHPNQHINEVYFPESAVICLMTVMSSGDTLETGTVGQAERGRLLIGNRKGLLAESCDCYQVIKENYEQVGGV